MLKNGHFGPKLQFLGLCEKNDSNKFSKIPLKVGKKIVLYDRIVILPEKIRFWCKIWSIRPIWTMWSTNLDNLTNNFFFWKKNFVATLATLGRLVATLATLVKLAKFGTKIEFSQAK